jgi:hypothetical protein
MSPFNAEDARRLCTLRRRSSSRSPSAGRTDRHRLDRGGNRQINAAIHRVAVTAREAIRSLKRHLARRI